MNFKSAVIGLAVGLFIALSGTVPAVSAASAPSASTADHSKFEELQVEFESGPEVTRACLGCHTDAARQIHKTKHWTWEYDNPVTGQRLGKRNVVNNFCIAATPNIVACTKCHIGYGWEDGSFDFAAEDKVDCLVCHDTTGLYSRDKVREPGKRRPKFEDFAQNVGPTSRRSCGACHFAGGGAKAVKHGDIDPTLAHPDYFVDVHMDSEGLDFSCSTCHTADQHQVQGSRYTPNAADEDPIGITGRAGGDRATCRACHGAAPHAANAKLNDHTGKIACQTCHVPQFSRGDYPTKMWWDWSTAGQLGADGKQISREDADGLEVYNSKKGDFVWDKHTAPEYRWFNGTVLYTLLDDRIDPAGVVQVNRFLGEPGAPGSRIWPVKVMRGKQPYDVESQTLIAPLTTTDKGYWETLDWDQANALGMQAVNRTYSGRFDFVATEMTWPITHMVAPAHEALQCAECHSREGLLKNLGGIYLPGAGGYRWLDRIGLSLALLTLLGVIVHAALRIYVHVKGTR